MAQEYDPEQVPVEEDELSQHALYLETLANKSNAPEAVEEKHCPSPRYVADPVGIKHEEWDEDIQRTKYCYSADDLLRNMNWFTVGKWVDIKGADDSYAPVLYRGKRCIFGTADSSCLFGLKAYHNPDSSIRKYSLSFCLRTDGRPEMEDLVLFLSKMDQLVQQHKPKGKDIFVSPVQPPNRNKASTLRVKIPSYKKQLNIKVVLEQNEEETKELQYPTVEEFNRYIGFNSKVSLMLLINNMWRAGGKYGISYKLLKVKLNEDTEDVDFRD